MLRVFLVIDDYNELLYLQTLLRKLGFDTEGLQNTKKYADVSLGFNPQVLITTAKGRKVNGIELIRTIHRKRGFPKIIALHSNEDPVKESEAKDLGIDLILESPTSAKKLILGLAQVAELDEEMLLEKYQKIRSSETDSEEDVLIASYDETGKEVGVQEKLFTLQEDRPIGVQFPLKKDPIEEDPGIDQVDLELDDAGKDVAHVQDIVAPLENKEQAEQRRKRNDQFLEKAEKPTPGRFDRERIIKFNRKLKEKPLSEDSAEIEQDRKDFVRALYEKDPSKKH